MTSRASTGCSSFRRWSSSRRSSCSRGCSRSGCAQDWKIGGGTRLRRPRQLSRAAQRRSASASRSGTRSYFTVLAVVAAGRCSARSRRSSSTANSRCAASCAAVFMMPMMATPVAIALVWTMMFHPQLGVLNYLLSLVGIGRRSLGVQPRHRDPVAGAGRDLAMDAARDADRARRPRRPADRALRERASSTARTSWQMFRYITLPLMWPFLMIALMIRTIDAVKASTSSS